MWLKNAQRRGSKNRHALNFRVILDFNRKSSDQIEGVSSLFVGVIHTPFSRGLLPETFNSLIFKNGVYYNCKLPIGYFKLALASNRLFGNSVKKEKHEERNIDENS